MKDLWIKIRWYLDGMRKSGKCNLKKPDQMQIQPTTLEFDLHSVKISEIIIDIFLHAVEKGCGLPRYNSTVNAHYKKVI